MRRIRACQLTRQSKLQGRNITNIREEQQNGRFVVRLNIFTTLVGYQLMIHRSVDVDGMLGKRIVEYEHLEMLVRLNSYSYIVAPRYPGL